MTPHDRDPKRVLFVSHEPAFGGAERSLLELIDHLDRARFEPSLACSANGPLPDAAADLGVPIHIVPMKFAGKFRKLRGLLRAADSICEIVAKEAIDLVHANTLIAGYPVVRAARTCAVPSVWHVRDLDYPWLAKRALHQADAIIANSRATASTIGDDRVTVIHNGVDDRFFQQPDRRAEVRAELGIAAHAPLVAIIGRLDPWKGHSVLIDAAATLRRELPGVHFLVVGSTPFGDPNGYGNALRCLANTAGVDDRVHFLGARDDVARIVAACDVLAHPSTSPEPFGRSIAEAMAAGVPVVGTDHGGIPELVTHGHDGLLVPPCDAPALATALHHMLGDHEFRALASSRARERANRSFRAEQHALAVQELFDSLLPAHGRSPTARSVPATV
ncbi:MAG: glycosyltransferase family 4 protein [Planctomycetes bacterium]|nr:glycosyltransferase family 4 protein [Planctomycetota bacterium]